MECSTWLDISAEAQAAKDANPEWQTDLSLVNLKDSRVVPYMIKLTDSQAKQLL